MKCSLKLIMSIKGHFRSNNFLRIILGYLHFITVKLSCIEYSFVSEIIENTFMKELSWISISNFESLQCASFALYYRTFMITKLEIFTAAEKFLTDCFFLQNVCIGITVRMFTVVLFQIFPLLPVQCFLPVVTSITVATDCGEMALYVRGGATGGGQHGHSPARTRTQAASTARQPEGLSPVSSRRRGR